MGVSTRIPRPAHFRFDAVEVDLNDLTSTNKILDVLGCDGSLRMHLTVTKSHIRFSADPQTLVLVTEIRWGHCKTIKRHAPLQIIDYIIIVRSLKIRNRQITLNESGGGDALTDFLEYMEMAPGGATAANIQYLKG